MPPKRIGNSRDEKLRGSLFFFHSGWILTATGRAVRSSCKIIKEFLSLFSREHGFGLLDGTNARDAQIRTQLFRLANFCLDLGDVNRWTIEQRGNIHFDDTRVGIVANALALEIIS